MYINFSVIYSVLTFELCNIEGPCAARFPSQVGLHSSPFSLTHITRCLLLLDRWDPLLFYLDELLDICLVGSCSRLRIAQPGRPSSLAFRKHIQC